MKRSTSDLIEHAKYSPSLDGKVKSEIKKKQVASQIRLATFVIAVITLVLNFYLLDFNSNPSILTGQKDIINGGIGSDEGFAKSSLLQYVNSTESTESEVLKYFDIKNDEIQRSKIVDLCVDCSSSEGRVVLTRDFDKQDTNESIKIEGKHYKYSKLSSAYPGADSLRALKFSNNTYILLESGNIVFSPQGRLILTETIPYQPKTEPGSSTLRKRISIKNHHIQDINNVSIDISNLIEGLSVSKYSIKPSSESRNKDSTIISWDKMMANQQIDIDLSYQTTFSSLESCTEIHASSLELAATKQEVCFDPSINQNSFPAEDRSLSSADPSEENLDVSIKTVSQSNGTEISNAKFSEEIKYIFEFRNRSNYKIENYQLQPVNISEILENADITDVKNGVISGKSVVWNNSLSLKPSESAYREFTIRMLEPHETNQNISDNKTKDCKMTIDYMSEIVSLDLPCAEYKNVQAITFRNNQIDSSIAIAAVSLIVITSIGLYYHEQRLSHRLALVIGETNEE